MLAAAYSPRHGHCTPESVTLGYARAARRAGATLVPNCRVTGGEVIDGTIRAGHTEAGRIEVGHTEAGRIEVGHTEAGRIETGHTEAGRIETGRIETGRIETGRIETGDRGVLRRRLVPDGRGMGPITGDEPGSGPRVGRASEAVVVPIEPDGQHNRR